MSLTNKTIPKIAPHIRSVLKDHQIEGITFMMDKVINKESGCILAHSMGKQWNGLLHLRP